MPNLRDRLVPLQAQPSGGLRSRLTPTQNTQPQQPFTTGINAAGIKIVNPQGALTEKRISNIADVEKKKQFEAIEKDLFEKESLAVQGVIDSLMAQGRPIIEIGPEELLSNENVKKIGIDNIGKVKKILDSYKKDKTDIATKNIIGAIEDLIELADNIPTGSRAYGRYIRAGLNRAYQSAGYLEDKDRFDALIEASLATIAKARGDVGNISEQEQKRYKPYLEQLGHPQIEVRKKARQQLQRQIKRDTGQDVNLSSPYQIRKNKEKQQNQTNGGFFIDQKAIDEELKRRGR